MSKSPSNEKEKPLAHPNTKGSQLTTTFAEVIEYSTPSNLQTQPHQEQLLKDLNQVYKLLKPYSFEQNEQSGYLLRHTVYGLIPLSVIVEAMEYAVSHPDEDTPGSGRIRWEYLKEARRAKCRFLEENATGQEDSAASLADRIRKRELPWLVTPWHINKAEDEGDVEYLKSIDRQQEEEGLPLLVKTAPSPEPAPAIVPAERSRMAQDESKPVAEVTGQESGGRKGKVKAGRS